MTMTEKFEQHAKHHQTVYETITNDLPGIWQTSFRSDFRVVCTLQDWSNVSTTQLVFKATNDMGVQGGVLFRVDLMFLPSS